MEELPIEVGEGTSPTPRSSVSLGGRPSGSFIAGALVVVVAVAVVLGTHRQSDQLAHKPSTSPSTTAHDASNTTSPSGVATTVDLATTALSTSPVPVRETVDVGAAVVGTHTGTELVIFGSDTLVRLDLDTGHRVITSAPTSSGGPTVLIPGLSSVLLRPLDQVPGYVVPDDSVPLLADPPLDKGGKDVFPGPATGLVWLARGDAVNDATGLDLYSFEGGVHQAPLKSVPTPDLQAWGPDGTGQVVLTGVGGAYAAGIDGLSRITTGDVFAAGPTMWLVRECDDHHVCTISTIDRSTGARAKLDTLTPFANETAISGEISPDGRTAAINLDDPSRYDDPSKFVVVDLRSGVVTSLPVHLTGVRPVWTLDSRYIFLVDSGAVTAFDRENGTSRPISIGGNSVLALAVRPWS